MTTTTTFFGFLLIFVFEFSCVIYKKDPIDINQLAEVKRGKVKITTQNGEKIKAQWTDVKPDDISIRRRARQTIIKAKDIKSSAYFGPEYKLVGLNDALTYEGNISIETDKKSYQFFDIRKEGENIIGFSRIGADTVVLEIPYSEIAKIKVQNVKASRTGNVFIGVGAGYLVLMGIGLAALAADPPKFSFGP
jgi:hypothetical protein